MKWGGEWLWRLKKVEKDIQGQNICVYKYKMRQNH